MAQIQIHTENRTPATTTLNINKHYPPASFSLLYSPLVSFVYHVLDLFAFLLTCTLKKIGTLRNPPKRFRRCQKTSPCVEMPNKQVCEICGTLKVLTVYRGEEPLPRNLLKFRRVLKKVSYCFTEPSWFLTYSLGFRKKPTGSAPCSSKL